MNEKEKKIVRRATLSAFQIGFNLGYEVADPKSNTRKGRAKSLEYRVKLYDLLANLLKKYETK